MEKLFTVELDQQGETMEIHLNKAGAEYLKNILDNLISNNQDEHLHFFSPDWGGTELTQEKQNEDDGVKLIHQLKVIYWK